MLIEKVNKGTRFLEPGQELAGYLTDSSICGAKGEGLGAGACAVVTPIGHKTPETLYYLEEVYVTGAPAKNWWGLLKALLKGASELVATGALAFSKKNKY